MAILELIVSKVIIKLAVFCRKAGDLKYAERLEKLLEQFMHENPYGDTRDLAEWFYNKGYKEGNDDAHKKMIFGK